MAGAVVKQEVIGTSETLELARAMGWTHREAIGCLALLWSRSQNREAVRASAAQIATWCEIEGSDERGRLIEAMTAEVVGYLKRARRRGSSEVFLDSFEIVGNRKAVAKAKVFKALRKKAGALRKDAFRVEKTPRGENKIGNGEKTQQTTAGKRHLFPVQDSEQRECYSPLLSRPLPTVHTFPSPPVPSRDEPEFPGLMSSTLSDKELAEAQRKLEAKRLASGLSGDGLRRLE